MNDRIRELVEQAVRAVDNPFPGNPLNDELEKMYIPDCFAEKFAELIVKECMELTHWKDFEMSVEQRIRLSVYQDIKEHFGVEE